MNEIYDVVVDEVSILTTDAAPAVPAARVLLTKAGGPAPVIAPAVASRATAEVLAAAEAAPGLGFMELAKAIRERDGIGRTAAMQKARREHPEAYEHLQAAAPAGIAAAPAPIAKRAPAETAFMQIAGKLRADRGLSRTAAMRAARHEHPEAFAALQGG